MFGQELDRYWKTVVNTISDRSMIVNTGGAIVFVNKVLERITELSEHPVECNRIPSSTLPELQDPQSPMPAMAIPTLALNSSSAVSVTFEVLLKESSGAR